MSREWPDEEAVRRLVERIVRRIDSTTHVILREPGRRSVPSAVQLALVRRRVPIAFELTEGEWRGAESAVGRERLARRLGAALGFQSPDQMTGPPS